MGFTEKPDFQGGFTKNQYIWRNCLKGWLEGVDLGGLDKKEGLVFARGDWYPNAHYGKILVASNQVIPISDYTIFFISN